MTDKLKLCPFCGEKPNYIAFGNDQHQIDCENTDCMACAGTPTRPTKELCFEAWNTRADLVTRPEPVTDDALREAVKLVKQHDVIIVEGIGEKLWGAISLIITHALKGQSQ